MKRWLQLLRTDWRHLRRDPMLVLTSLLPVPLALMVRFGLPWLDGRIDLDLAAYEDFIHSMLVVIVPPLYGMAMGFLLLEERDEGVLEAIAVTPLGREGLLLYRVVTPTLAGILFALIALIVLGVDTSTLVHALPSVVMASLLAPIWTIGMAWLARNRVEGVTVAKGLNLLALGPFVILLVDGPGRFLGGIFPTFWITNAYISTGWEYAISVLLGILTHVGLVALVWWRYRLSFD